MANQNEDVVNDGYKLFSAGDMDGLKKLFTADFVHHVPRRADVQHNRIVIELTTAEGHLRDEGGAVHALGGAEGRAREAVGDHEVAADGQAEHGLPRGFCCG